MKSCCVFRWAYACRLWAGFLILTLALMNRSYAEDTEDGTGSAQTIYVQLKPSFVTNYQSEKLRYLRADVALRVANPETQTAIEHHSDNIKHVILMLLSRQEEDALTSSEGLEVIRQDALDEILQILDSEGASADVMEVLFTSFILE